VRESYGHYWCFDAGRGRYTLGHCAGTISKHLQSTSDTRGRSLCFSGVLSEVVATNNAWNCPHNAKGPPMVERIRSGVWVYCKNQISPDLVVARRIPRGSVSSGSTISTIDMAACPLFALPSVPLKRRSVGSGALRSPTPHRAEPCSLERPTYPQGLSMLSLLWHLGRVGCCLLPDEGGQHLFRK